MKEKKWSEKAELGEERLRGEGEVVEWRSIQRKEVKRNMIDRQECVT